MPKLSTRLAKAIELTTTELDALIPVKTFSPPSFPRESLSLKAYHIADLDPSLKAFALDLVEANMKPLYEESKGGWNRREKQKEMNDKMSRYLIATLLDQNNNDGDHTNISGGGGQPVAMIHFQFLEEETMSPKDADVIYCFEIQVCAEFQRRGIGAYLIQALEAIGKANELEKAMLTVFKANTGAVKFYTEQLGYEYDEISPRMALTKGRASRFDYEILSKKLQ